MLAGGTDLLYRKALAGPHRPYVKVEVWRGAERLIDGLSYSTGSVDATLTSAVARTCSLDVHEDLYPWEPDDPLSAGGSYLKAYRGIEFADGELYRWQVFRGKIQNAVLTEDGKCQIKAQDRAAEVQEAKFTRPENSTPNVLVFDEWRRIISDGVPDAAFGPSDTFFQRVPVLTWEEDRTQALEEMATTLGAFWYPLADGQYVLRRVPWTVPGNPVVTYRDGDGGTVTATSVTTSRESIHNAIALTGERVDGTPPVFALAEDTDPASPTYITGPFGRRGKLIKLETPTTQQTAEAAARDYLHRTTAFTQAWAFSCTPDASLELGDVIALDARGKVGMVQVVAGFTLPLTATGDMRVAGRSQVVGLLEVT